MSARLRRVVLRALLPFLSALTATISTAAIWVYATPTPTAAVIVALSSFFIIVVGDAATGASGLEAIIRPWQTMSRLVLAGATLGIASASTINAHLSLLLTAMALGAAVVTAARAVSSDYEAYLCWIITASEWWRADDDQLADEVARLSIKCRAWALGLTVDAVYVVGGLPLLWPFLWPPSWAIIDWLLTVIFVVGAIVVLPTAIAAGFSQMEERLRGLSDFAPPDPGFFRKLMVSFMHWVAAWACISWWQVRRLMQRHRGVAALAAFLAYYILVAAVVAAISSSSSWWLLAAFILRDLGALAVAIATWRTASALNGTGFWRRAPPRAALAP